MLSGKRILVGVTGSIAAFKAATIVRLLVKAQAETRVLMTSLASAFITPLTLSTLSKHPVMTDFFDPANGQWNNHIDLGIWADAFVIAPATANTMAKMASGIADNLLLTTYLSARCPVFIAPAMDMDMLDHPATKKNMDTLQSYGNILLDPSTGELASGLSGKGRMVEPEEILSTLLNYFETSKKKSLIERLSGKNILVTAGPTYEPIDAVRFIGNRSSGKMGIALANELADLGAKVTLVCGPVAPRSLRSKVVRINVQTAAEMHDECIRLFTKADGAFLTAAVADYRPISPSAGKIKREANRLLLELKTTDDIAARLGEMKKSEQFLIGFALETSNEVKHAAEKLRKKNLDFIALNSLNDEGAGFDVDTNKITIIDRHNNITHFELKTKEEVARDIIGYLADMIL